MKPSCHSMLSRASAIGICSIPTAPVLALASTTVPPSAPAAPNAAAGAVVAVVILGLLVLIGVAVKLVDLKRKHEDEAAALQARVTDALMMDRALSGLALTPVVQVPLRRNALATVSIRGIVPAPELRESALQLVMRTMEQSGTSCRVEDHILVDPLVSRRAA